MAAYIDAAGIGKKGSCHLFRHSMATAMLEGGADTRFIQQMLGHESLETTQIYTQVSIGKLQDMYQATHPAARLQRKEKPQPHSEEKRADLLAQLDGEADEDADE